MTSAPIWNSSILAYWRTTDGAPDSCGRRSCESPFRRTEGGQRRVSQKVVPEGIVPLSRLQHSVDPAEVVEAGASRRRLVGDRCERPCAASLPWENFKVPPHTRG